jgi:histone H3/H4
VKKIIMLDPEVQRVSADGLWLVGEATRMFLHALAAKGAAAVTAKKRKTIMLQDFETLVRWVHARQDKRVPII